METEIKNKLYQDVQSFFSKNTVLIIGSGLSCAEGLPGMWKLAMELIEEVPKRIKKESIDEWNNIQNDLLDSNGNLKKEANLEATLLKFPPNEDIEAVIRKVTTDLIKQEEKDVIMKVVIGEKNLRFSSFIKKFSIPDSGLSIITTNYDRLIEIAAEVEGIPVDNLFYGKNISQLDEKKSQMSFCERIDRSGRSTKRVFTPKILIYKPHGCLGWYMYNENPIHSSHDLGLERLLITPGANKFRSGYEKPFDLHRTKANNAIDNASKIILIGYGFNDEHLETHLKPKILSNTATLVITRELSENTKKIINGRDNVIALSNFNSEQENGTEVFYKNKTYKICGIDLWDVEKLIKEVF
ncbi:SIR2 family protein [Planococcus soli]|uniref:SIR2 family protein n=1 Tax=Planococcus soli TaxID=2666072 RepID=UPI00115E86C9|nr:SIR2 family protein [Planococcus soli]